MEAEGLAGEEISLGGRILAIADAYEVMTANRAYKVPLSAAAKTITGSHTSGFLFFRRALAGRGGIS